MKNNSIITVNKKQFFEEKCIFKDEFGKEF